jgi:hypothetical protein
MKDYGFVAPVRDENDKVFGAFNSLPKVILQSNRNWVNFLPLYERQYGTGWDSYGCTVFGTLNALETILKRLNGKDYDFSERYIYNLINLKAPGADPKEAAQAIRKEGVIEQKELPYIDSLEKFASPRPMTKEQIEKGHEWLKQYGFGYEWVYEGIHDRKERLKRMKECLQYSPLGVSVDAWQMNSRGEYISNGQNNHWCLLYMIDEQDRPWIFDTYDQTIKTLSSDHDIQFCMRYHVTVVEENLKLQISLLEKVVLLLKQMLNKYATTIGKAKRAIGDAFAPAVTYRG